ncbi:MAG: hypothetical protein ACJ76H_10970 [Bacteriovoracaceae bacterium]
MKIVITILLIMFCSSARADFILSSGVGSGTKISSDEKLHGERVLNANSGGGFILGVDYVALPSVSFSITGGFQLRKGQVQYQNDTVRVDNLETAVSQFYLDEGVRWRFVNRERFRMFAGSGVTLGYFSLVFDKDDFKKLTGGSTTGYHESEGSGQAGLYGEVGAEYFFNKVSGARLLAKYEKVRTGAFDNLADKSLTFEYATFHLQYIHYVNF